MSGAAWAMEYDGGDIDDGVKTIPCAERWRGGRGGGGGRPMKTLKKKNCKCGRDGKKNTSTAGKITQVCVHGTTRGRDSLAREFIL